MIISTENKTAPIAPVFSFDNCFPNERILLVKNNIHENLLIDMLYILTNLTC